MATATFPRRLYDMLSIEDNSVLGWNPDGRSFKISDVPLFCSDVLPRYFRHCKLTSFQRQLNLYGFQRVHVGPLGGSYHHPLFTRDNPANVDTMRRTVKKGAGAGGGDEDDEAPTSTQRPPLPSGPWSLPFASSFQALPADSAAAAAAAASAALAAVSGSSSSSVPHSSVPLAPAMPPGLSQHSKGQYSMGSSSFLLQRPQNSSTSVAHNSNQSPLYEYHQPLSRTSSDPNAGLGRPSSGRKSHNSSLDSVEWLAAADLLQSVDSRASIRSQSTGKSSSSPYPEEESDDEETLVEFDINDPLNQGGSQNAQVNIRASSGSSGSSGGSSLDLLATASSFKSEAVSSKAARLHSSSSKSLDHERGPRKHQRTHSGSSSSLLASAWGSASETLSPQRLERLVKQVPTDTLNLQAYDSLAGQMIGSMGAKSALSLTLALLGRSFPTPSASNSASNRGQPGTSSSSVAQPPPSATAAPSMLGWATSAADAEAASQLLSEHLSSFGLGSPPPGSRI